MLDMKRFPNFPNVGGFRSKIIEAVVAMQDELGITDLGKLHHEPLVNDQGSVMFVTVNYVYQPKTVQVAIFIVKKYFYSCKLLWGFQGLNLKWVNLNKLVRRSHGTPCRDSDSMSLLSGQVLVSSSLLFLTSDVSIKVLISEFSQSSRRLRSIVRKRTLHGVYKTAFLLEPN